MTQPDKKKKKEKKRRSTKPKVKVDTIRAVKFKTVDMPKIKAMPQSSEIDFSNQIKKESKQPIIIHNYLYPPGQSQDLQRDYEQMNANQLPIRQVAPVEQQSVRSPERLPEPAPEPEQEPGPVTEILANAKERRMIALQNRGGPYTKEEAKLVFGIDLRTKSGRDTMQGLIDGGIVKQAWK